MALLHVIKYAGPSAGSQGEELWLVWKYPCEAVPLGSQLVVGPGQEAIFVNEGRPADRFGPGTYALTTGNIPLIQKLVNLPFGGDAPFKAEVYFVNRVAKLDMKWGTADPFRIRDPAYDIIVPVRAYGQFGIRVRDAAAFLLGLIGALQPDQVTTTDRIAQYFRGAILSKVKDAIGEAIASRRLGVLDVPARLGEIGDTCRERARSEFEHFGLELLTFFVESISVPEGDPSVAALRQALAGKATTLIAAEARKGAKVLDAEAQKAEIEMLGDERYRLKRSFDAMEKAAESRGGPGGSLMDLGIGLGAAGAIGKAMGEIASTVVGPASPRARTRCPACGFEAPPEAKFCGGCGHALRSESAPCPHCKGANPPGARFCNSCGRDLA